MDVLVMSKVMEGKGRGRLEWCKTFLSIYLLMEM